MKKNLLLLALAAMGLGALLGASPLSAKSTVEVVFDHPEKFTDIKDTYMATETGQAAILEDLKENIVKRASKQLIDGQTLTITFTDIDLAGDFEPGRSASASDVRMIRDMYPPRLDFSFKLTDQSGKVLEEGQEKLRDMNFMLRANPTNESETLRFEKDMLNDWIRSNIKKFNKK